MRISDWSSDVCSSDLHVDDDADSPAFLPHKLRISAMIFDLGRCVGAVAQLVLEPHQVDGVALPIGRDARREEAGKAFLRISERQEGIAHGRGAEPFMAGQPKRPPAAYGDRKSTRLNSRH